ncbi:MAG: glycosyltransferase family 4 protein, partial [Chloroflexota bacterium]
AVFHACDFDTVLPALFFKLIYRNKLVYDIFDFYADHLRRTPRIIKALIRWLDLGTIRMADAVILVDEAREAQIARGNPKRLEFIYNSPEEQRIPENTVRQNDKFRIVYVGLLQKERGLFQLLDLIARHPEWELDLAGFGGDEEIIKSRSYGQDNINFYGRIPYPEALALGTQSDLFYALYDPHIPNHRYASPNKIFEAMMLEKPVLVAAGTNADRIVQECESGVVVDYFDNADIEAKIEFLANNPTVRAQLGANGRRAYENKYGWKNMKAKLLNLYNNIL